MLTAIIVCEIGFWVLLGGGLAARYLLRLRTLSALLLLAVPLVDVALLIFSAVDLRGGAEPRFAHALAAIYLGVTVVFGHRMIRWADVRFAHRFAGGPAPEPPPRHGRAHAAHERRGWFRHLLAYAMAALFLGGFALLIGEPRHATLWAPMVPWGIAVVIDGIVALSYTFSPRTAKSKA